MEVAALNVEPPRRGADLLLAHCSAVGRVGGAERPSPASRLEAAVGSQLAGLLLFALAPQRRRGCSSP